MKRVAVLGSIVCAGAMAVALAPLAALQPPAGQAPPPGQGRAGGRGGPAFGPVEKIEKVADNLYMVAGSGGNTAVYLTANGVVLVDTKVPNSGQAILDQVKTVTDKPITHIINTHTHFDHTGSNMFFPARVEIVAHENASARMAKGTNPNFQDPANTHGLPDTTFKDKLTLLSGKDAIDVYHFGPAHTDGDAFIVFRGLRVMHAGDAFARKGLPLIDANNGGSGVEFGQTMAKAAKGIRNVERVIPGHSTVMTWADFVEYGEFNRLYLEAARAALKAGKTAEQAAAELKLPEKFKDYQLVGAGGRGGTGGNFGVIFTELQKK